MWIDSHPVLHIIDRGTRYSVAKFMKNETAQHVWEILIEFWITVFTGYPYIISHDQGPQFTSEYFKVSCSQLGIITKETSTESHNSLGLCERYHSIIRRVYNRLKEEDPRQVKETRLSLAVHAVNNTAGPEGLTPTVLVFGAVPRLPLPDDSTLPPDQKSRIKAMKIARTEMETITAQRRIEEARKHRNWEKPHPAFQFGDKVRIWRENDKQFVGPYTVHGYDNEKTVYVMTDRIRPFSTRYVRLIPPEPTTLRTGEARNIPPAISEQVANLQQLGQALPTSSPAHARICEAFFTSEVSHTTLESFREQGYSETFLTVIVKNKKDPRFTQAKMDEIDKLVKMGTYEIVPEHYVPRNSTILQSRFVLAIKNASESDEYFKARLVILGHIDPDKPRVVNEAPTVMKSSIRLTI